VFCREHAAQLRGIYNEITAADAEVVAIGTGNAMYAKAFVDDEHIPFPVLLDEDGEAANVASVKGGAGALFKLASPSVLKASARARKAGHHQGKTGSRPLQLGATFVIGPGENIIYEHLDNDVGDHAPLADVLAALKG
jgi:peroxiredoxin